eukprot:6173709-Pleurochrysis_carterae.AAC.1
MHRAPGRALLSLSPPSALARSAVGTAHCSARLREVRGHRSFNAQDLSIIFKTSFKVIIRTAAPSLQGSISRQKSIHGVSSAIHAPHIVSYACMLFVTCASNMLSQTCVRLGAGRLRLARALLRQDRAGRLSSAMRFLLC